MRPSDIIDLVVLWRLRYKLSLRDLAETFLTGGSSSAQCGSGKPSWHRLWQQTFVGSAETELAAAGMLMRRMSEWRGQWRHLHRAIVRDGVLIDVMLSEHRDLAAAKAFFRSAKTVTGVTPDSGYHG
jgi:putative transposase